MLIRMFGKSIKVEMSMQKILIVGGAGYIGGYMTDQLIAAGYHVTVYDNLIYETRYLKPVSFIFGDVRDKKKLQKILPEYDVVIWLAAIVGDGACAVDPQLTQAINEDAVIWLTKSHQGKIIFMSTCSVYGINHDLLDESSETNPLSVYAVTKLNAEKYLREHSKDYLIFRLGTLYGLSDYHSRIRLDLVANVLAKRATLGEKLVVFGGEQWRPLLHVKDVTTAVIFGIENQISGLYNLSSSNYQIFQIADEIKEIIPDAQVEYVDQKFEDLRNYRVKSTGYFDLGWKPQFVLKDGVNEIYTAISEHRIKELDDPVYSNHAYLKELSATGSREVL